MNKKTLPLILLWILLLSVYRPTVSAQEPVTIPNQGHFIAESIGDPQTVDPAWSYDTASGLLIQNVYDTLIFFDREEVGEFVPSLATDWWINQDPHPDAPEGTDSTWYFEIRGLSGIHTMTASDPNKYTGIGDPRSTWWHDVSANRWFCTDWHLRSWTDTDASGDLSVSDQIDMERDQWPGDSGGKTVQYFHVDYVPLDGTVPYTITVTEKRVMFQCGEDELTPDVVEYSFERAMVQDRSGGPVWMFNEPLIGEGWPDKSGWPEAAGNPIDTAVESNSTHVWFNLAMSYPPFLQILSQTWASIVCCCCCIEYGDWNGDWTNWKAYEDPEMSPLDAAGNVMDGTGPYALDYWTHGVEWSIVKFEDYWGGWPAPHCSSSLDRFTEKVVYEWGTRYADLLGGYADAVYVPRAFLPQMILNWPTQWQPGMPTNPEEYAEGIRCIPGLATLQEANFFFNFDINPATGYVGSGSFPDGIPLDFFSDVRIRQAFSYTFDYQEFLDTMFWGEAVQPRSCVPEGILYQNPANPVYSQNFEMARDLFQAASADTESPAYGVWTSGFEMTVTYNTGNVPRETTASMLRDGVEYVFDTYGGGDVTINVLPVPWPTYLGELVGYPLFKSLLTIFVIGWLADFADPHNWVVPYMHSQGDFSHFQSYNNPTVDALIAEGIATPDGPDREAIYYELQQIYFDDCPSVGTSQAYGRHWERSWYEGWYYNPILPGVYVYNIWKGLTGDIDGNNEVGITDAGKVSAHWCIPGVIEGPAGYDVIADVGPTLQYPTPGVISIVDAGVISAHYREYVP